MFKKAAFSPSQTRARQDAPFPRARPQVHWRAERTQQYVSTTTGRERRWRTFSTFPLKRGKNREADARGTSQVSEEKDSGWEMTAKGA